MCDVVDTDSAIVLDAVLSDLTACDQLKRRVLIPDDLVPLASVAIDIEGLHG